MYKHVLRVADQYFGKKLVLGAAVEGPETMVVGEHHGSLGLTVAASGPVAIAAGSKITVSLAEADKKDETFAVMPLSMTFAFAAKLDAEDGDTLLQIVLPDCKKYVKASITASGAVGTVDAFLNYLAR